VVEDQDKEKPEEYKGEKEEVKLASENKVKNSVRCTVSQSTRAVD